MKRSVFAKFRKDDKGGVAVETAMFMTVFALFAVTVLDYGLLYTRGMELSQAARAGAQYGQLNRPREGDYSEVVAATKAALRTDGRGKAVAPVVSIYCECSDGGSSDLSGCTTLSCTDSDEVRGAYLSVDVTEDYSTMFKYPGLKQTHKIGREAVIRLN